MMVFDLDPGPPANIVQCAQVGMWLREIFEHFRPAKFSQDFRLERAADLCPAEHADQLRGHQNVCPRAGPAAGRPASRSGGFRHEERIAQRQGAGGLEPERSAQDDDCGVFAAGQRASHGFDAGEVGRSRAHAEEERRDLCWCSKPEQVLKRVEKMGDLFEPALTLKQKLPKSAEDVGARVAAARSASKSETRLEIAAQADNARKPATENQDRGVDS